MLIFLKARIVLFAVEKTGTTSLQLALQDQADIKFLGVKGPVQKHTGFADYKTNVEPDLLARVNGPLDYVAVFREPLSWLSSWYRYRLRDEDAGHPQSTRGISYERFVIDFCRKPELRPRHVWIKAQSERVCGQDGTVGINHLFRYEDMESLIRFLEYRLDRTIHVNRTNVSMPLQVPELSSEILTLYKNRFARDFEIYNTLPVMGR